MPNSNSPRPSPAPHGLRRSLTNSATRSYPGSCSRLRRPDARFSCWPTSPTMANAASQRSAGLARSPSSRHEASLKIGLPMSARDKDPSVERSAARQAPTVKELFERFMTDYSEGRNKPSTVKSNRGYGKRHIIPILGHLKVPAVTRANVSDLMKRMSKSPTNANRVLSALRKMFNLAEVWGLRPDGSNPCRHIPKYPERGKTRLITDAELKRLYAYLDKAEVEGLEHPLHPPRHPAPVRVCGADVGDPQARMGVGRSRLTAASNGPTARPAACRSR